MQFIRRKKCALGTSECAPSAAWENDISPANENRRRAQKGGKEGTTGKEDNINITITITRDRPQEVQTAAEAFDRPTGEIVCIRMTQGSDAIFFLCEFLSLAIQGYVVRIKF